jgi:hypothetical protein
MTLGTTEAATSVFARMGVPKATASATPAAGVFARVSGVGTGATIATSSAAAASGGNIFARFGGVTNNDDDTEMASNASTSSTSQRVGVRSQVTSTVSADDDDDDDDDGAEYDENLLVPARDGDDDAGIDHDDHADDVTTPASQISASASTSALEETNNDADTDAVPASASALKAARRARFATGAETLRQARYV